MESTKTNKGNESKGSGVNYEMIDKASTIAMTTPEEWDVLSYVNDTVGKLEIENAKETREEKKVGIKVVIDMYKKRQDELVDKRVKEDIVIQKEMENTQMDQKERSERKDQDTMMKQIEMEEQRKQGETWETTSLAASAIDNERYYDDKSTKSRCERDMISISETEETSKNSKKIKTKHHNNNKQS